MATTSGGGANYVHFGNNAPVNPTSDFSVLIYANVAVSASDIALIGKRSGFTAGTNLFSITLAGTRRPTITKNGNFHIWNTPQISTGSWFYMCVIGTSTGAKAFVNGTQASGTNGSNLAVGGDWRSGSATSANLDLFSINGTLTLNGSIAKAIIWNRALSDGEAIVASKGLPSSLIGRTFSVDLTRDIKDLNNNWAPTIIGSLTKSNNPKMYSIL